MITVNASPPQGNRVSDIITINATHRLKVSLAAYQKLIGGLRT